MALKIAKLLLKIILFFPIVAIAAPTWKMIPDKSSITFTATQNNSPVIGQFKSFTSDIQFDPEQLTTSHITVTVDIASVTTAYSEVANTLKTTDWFDVKNFPQAIFKANHFKKTGENTYEANGTLTIRNKTIPTILNFTLEKYTATESIAKGAAVLKRTAFDVGTGDWKKTDEIKDNVEVKIMITAIRQ